MAWSLLQYHACDCPSAANGQIGWAARLAVMLSLSHDDPLRPASPPLRSPMGSICDVLPAAAALLGVHGGVDPLGLSESVGEVRRVAVVLVDGMGWHLLPMLTADAPLLASVL